MDEVTGFKELRKTSSLLICGQSQSGKSTFCRYLANSLLNEGRVVALLDLDPGQSEITPPGLLSLHLLDNALYTFPYSSQGKLLASYYLGGLSPSVSPLRYLKCVDALLQDWKRFVATQSERHCTLLVNSSGWIQAMGRDLLCELCTKFAFDKVYLLGERDPDLVGTINKSLTILQGFQTFGMESDEAVVKDPVVQRECMWIKWMHQCLRKDHQCFPLDSTLHKERLVSVLEAQNPFVVDINHIDIHFTLGKHKTYKNSSQDLAKQLKLMVVGLCCTRDITLEKVLAPCLGLALVRSIHNTQLFLLTTIDEDNLSRVDQIQIGPLKMERSCLESLRNG